MAKRSKNKEDEMVEWAAIALLLLLFLGFVVWGVTSGGWLTGGGPDGGPNGGPDDGGEEDGGIPDCAQYDISQAFRDYFTPAVIIGIQNSCEGNGGIWYETEHIILCDFNAVTAVDCNDANIVAARELCESMSATYYCDNMNGVHGCDCDNHFTDEAGDCSTAGLVPAEYMDKCQQYTCDESGQKCMWYPTDPKVMVGVCSCVDYVCDMYYSGGGLNCEGACEQGGDCSLVNNIFMGDVCTCRDIPPDGDGEPNMPCVDSDGGFVLGVKGTCTDSTGSYTDFCVSGRTVMEYACGTVDGLCHGSQQGCNTGTICNWDGACIPDMVLN